MNALSLSPFVEEADHIQTMTRALDALCDGSGYVREDDLPKLLVVPEFWLIAGRNVTLTEAILADLEGLRAAQLRHLHAGRGDLFDVQRFWTLTNAIRGELRTLASQKSRTV